ncbi:MAG: paraquat-inducible protein A [Burkholderiales bacterium]|jgi:paraquat-inducible protein A|nr:paraquat-inducible protein A [Burkholderiales bacterium]
MGACDTIIKGTARLQEQHLVVCEQCDAVHRWRPLSSGEVARCSRCAAVLARGHRLGVHSMLALTLAALFVLLIANLSTIVDIHLRGAHTAATLPEAVRLTWRAGEPVVAVLAAITAIIAPALLILLRLVMLLPLAFGGAAPYFALCMRALHEATRWSMVEVLMVAAAVSIVRIAALANAQPGPGMFAFGTLALLLAALESGGLKHLWREVK